MARPQKQGLDYFSFDVSFFRDIRIRKLIKYHGVQAVPIYEIILCSIYEHGYYLEWDEDLPFTISEISHLEEDTIIDIFNYCLDIGLFDKSVFTDHHVITSHSIQQRYFSACGLTHRKKPADTPYYLLGMSQEESHQEKTAVSSEQTLFSSEEMQVNSEKTGINSDESAQIKENKRKDNNSLRSSLSPSPTPPPARDGVSVDSVDGHDASLSAKDGVEILKLDNDWFFQMQRKFCIGKELLIRWLDSFVVDCDCRGKQQHESLSDVMQHFNDWMTKVYKSNGKNKSSKNSSQGLTSTQRWMRCQAELCHAVGDDISSKSFSVVKFLDFDDSSSTLHIQVPDKEVYEYMEQNFVDIMSSILSKHFGASVKLQYHLP